MTATASTPKLVAAAQGSPRAASARPVAPAVAVARQVTVTLPVFNESRIIERTFDAVARFAAEAPEYHFVFVDDGSADDTAAILRRRIAQSGLTNVELLRQPVNRGKGEAIKAGLEHCKTELFIFTDGDLAYPLDHLPELLATLEKHEVAIGSRSLVPVEQKNTKPMRRLLGWGFNKIARVMLGLPNRDTQAGLKGFRSAAAREIFKRQQIPGFAFDVEVLFLARKLGYSVGEIPARVAESHSYKVSKVNLLSEPLRMFGCLWRVRWNDLRGRYA